MAITTTPSGGPQGEFSTYTPIYAQTLTSAAASITFSNIPTTYTDLVLVGSVNTSSEGGSVCIRFNGDTGSNYCQIAMYGTGSSASSSKLANNPNIYVQGIAYGSPSASNLFMPFNTSIQNYSNPTTYKTILTRASGNQTAGADVEAIVGTWRNTSPITTIYLYNNNSSNFSIGSTFTLYGIKAAAPAPKATGGDVITTDGTYWYHAFKNTGVFETKQALTVDYLVVAGGGAGGSGIYNAGSGANGGGGGAGGYRTSIGGSTLSLNSGTGYAVVVGAGGAPAAQNAAVNNGTNSSFATISATGGGGGAPAGNGGDQAAGNGGSGGGGASDGQAPLNAAGTGNAGGYSPVEGYAGGTGSSAAQGTGGGGGGAGGVGTNAGSTTPGSGGVGSNSASALAAATGTGVSGYFAGGGGGSGNVVNGANYTPGSGGSGGGGAAGSNNSSGNAGTANTGGGGGASSGTGSTSGAGGSGIVIVRYAV